MGITLRLTMLREDHAKRYGGTTSTYYYSTDLTVYGRYIIYIESCTFPCNIVTMMNEFPIGSSLSKSRLLVGTHRNLNE